MPILMDSGNPEEKEAIATCITCAVPKSERPDKDFKLFLVEKFAEVLRKTERLYKVEVHVSGDYFFTLYTYGEPLDKNKEDDE
jgi:hypothetical protein